MQCVRQLRQHLVGLRQISSQGNFFKELPIIDIAPLIAPNSTLGERAKVGNELHEACKRVGFFYIRNGMAEAIARTVRTQARQWFALPEATKREILLRPESHYRGYQPLGVNVTQNQRDWHEGIDLYKEISPGQAALLPPSPIHGINPLLTHIPSFRNALELYISSCLGLGAALMRGIALGLHLPENAFEGERAGDPYWVTRVIHYPPLPSLMNTPSISTTSKDPSLSSKTNTSSSYASGSVTDDTVESVVSCGAHTDYGLLTIVNQDDDLDLTALQVRNGKGEWIDAPPLPGTFVCNIGDMLRIWTNGMYRPTLHRVVHRHPTKSRISIPFFYEPNFEAIVKPFPELVAMSREEEIIPGVRYGSHLEAKVLNNFKLDGANQGLTAGG
ncbi:hypothetical protein Ndes2526B_g04190 [Nannochloris sp. 'desiccata']|nr:hypothetical protein KSW81_001035 [Chlorella desiccata (nom. nud.)]KAH7620274.1 putative 2-oxoglutarate-dependent dioxygenase 33 [Chlorella desiccata (nom. nud.)]